MTQNKRPKRLVTHLREGTVVPDVTVVGEAVADVTQTALLNVLLDGVEGLLFGDLMACQHACARHWEEGLRRTSCLALVQRGISTIMLSTVCCSLAYRGMSWKGETTLPFCSMYTLCSVGVR